VKIHLHKVIPFGAGLGGGSADAASMLVLLNSMFDLNLSKDQLKRYAVQIGADCPFFIDNTPQYATGIGDLLENIDVDLSGWHLLLLVPDIHVATPDAYKFIKPGMPKYRVKDIVKQPLHKWKKRLNNDFEQSVFIQYPQINELKEYLYNIGAEYASMSGSGSSVFGLFAEKPAIDINNCFVWTDEIK
jgi:4-diphosphocytidyl-2-C-methyl-D-erythritol kinase